MNTNTPSAPDKRGARRNSILRWVAGFLILVAVIVSIKAMMIGG